MIRCLALSLAAAGVGAAGAPAPAAAFNPIKPVCGAVGWVSGAVGKACSVVQHGDRVIKAGKKLTGGHVVGAAKTLLGSGGSSAASASAARAATVVGLAAIGAWVLGGAKFTLHETAKVLSQTTTPQLRSTWFSATYWRMAGIAAVLTIPFLFAAAIQALMRSDIALLARAAFGYLPLAMLGVGIAAPVTMLLLATSDELSSVVSSAAGNASGNFLEHTAIAAGALTAFAVSPFLAFIVGLFTVAAALTLWLELLVREAAVYVIVLMLPLAFAALVWPARRIWAVRAIELLVALILSKFAIVAVLSLGGAALSRSFSNASITGALAGGTLVLMAAFAPWALLRLLPLAELASGAAGTLRRETSAGASPYPTPHELTDRVENLIGELGHQNGAAAETRSGALLTQMNGDQPLVERPEPHRGEEQSTPLASEDATAADDRRSADESIPPIADGAGAVARDVDGEVPATTDEDRLPEMEPMWQAPDFQWRPLKLTIDDWPPPRPWDEDAGTSGKPAPGTRSPQGPGADDPDPRPPEQPPLEGRL